MARDHTMPGAWLRVVLRNNGHIHIHIHTAVRRKVTIIERRGSPIALLGVCVCFACLRACLFLVCSGFHPFIYPACWRLVAGCTDPFHSADFTCQPNNTTPPPKNPTRRPAARQRGGRFAGSNRVVSWEEEW